MAASKTDPDNLTAEEKEKLEKRRAYDRKYSANTRKKTKAHIDRLTAENKQLRARVNELEASNGQSQQLSQQVAVPLQPHVAAAPIATNQPEAAANSGALEAAEKEISRLKGELARLLQQAQTGVEGKQSATMIKHTNGMPSAKFQSWVQSTTEKDLHPSTLESIIGFVRSTNLTDGQIKTVIGLFEDLLQQNVEVETMHDKVHDDTMMPAFVGADKENSNPNDGFIPRAKTLEILVKEGTNNAMAVFCVGCRSPLGVPLDAGLVLCPRATCQKVTEAQRQLAWNCVFRSQEGGLCCQHPNGPAKKRTKTSPTHRSSLSCGLVGRFCEAVLENVCGGPAGTPSSMS